MDEFLMKHFQHTLRALQAPVIEDFFASTHKHLLCVQEQKGKKRRKENGNPKKCMQSILR